MKRCHLIMLCCLCLWPLSVSAQQARYRLNFKLSLKNFADTLAIEYDAGRVFVPVELGGHRLRFLLDTGAAQTVVYDDVPVEGCTMLGYIRSVDALDTEASVPMVSLPPLQLGRITFTGMQATVCKRPPMRQKIDGIVGFDVVCRGLLMKIDAARRQLIITDRRRHFDAERHLSLESTYRVLPFRHTPYVMVQPFTGYSEQVLLDTGSPFLYRMNRQHFDDGRQACMAQNPRQLQDTLEGSFMQGLHGRESDAQVLQLQLDSLRWGGFVMRNVSTRTTQGLSHLGGPLLQYGSLLFMPHRKRLRFTPYIP